MNNVDLIEKFKVITEKNRDNFIDSPVNDNTKIEVTKNMVVVILDIYPSVGSLVIGVSSLNNNNNNNYDFQVGLIYDGSTSFLIELRRSITETIRLDKNEKFIDNLTKIYDEYLEESNIQHPIGLIKY